MSGVGTIAALAVALLIFRRELAHGQQSDRRAAVLAFGDLVLEVQDKMRSLSNEVMFIRQDVTNGLPMSGDRLLAVQLRWDDLQFLVNGRLRRHVTRIDDDQLVARTKHYIEQARKLSKCVNESNTGGLMQPFDKASAGFKEAAASIEERIDQLA